ncbi:MAG: SpoIIE family protein phosphatase, partial [Bacteroidales bacterium]|nr:SpoIIE family protein phosphatase [Bacteroidales bacterium]
MKRCPNYILLKRKILLFFLSFIFSAGLTNAQKGLPYLSNFQLPGGFSPQNWSITQDEDGLLLLANSRGILSFDGSLEGWHYLEPEIIPYSIAKDPRTGKIYVGTDRGIGYLKKNKYGDYEYIPLSPDNERNGFITHISFSGNKAYFYSERAITTMDLFHHENRETIELKQGESFSGYFIFDTTLYTNLRNKGLYKSLNGELIPLQTDHDFSNDIIRFFVSFNSQKILIATDNSFLYLFDGEKFSDYRIEDEDYLFKARISDAISLPNNEIALSTRTGGCIIIDKISGKSKFIINYQSGLPDDEIFAITKDKGNGLWLTHERGATRIDLSLPIQNYNAFPGLEGNLAEIIRFNGTIYVSTSEGVFYLHKVKNYTKTNILIENKRNNVTKQPSPTKNKEVEVRHTDNQNSGKKPNSQKSSGFLSNLFKRKKNEEDNDHLEEVDLTKPQATNVVIETEKAFKPKALEIKYTRKTLVSLESISYRFSKVSGLDAKCKHLVSFNNHLLVASNTGLYEIKKHKSELIIDYAYINSIEPSTEIPNRVYIGTESGVHIIDFKKDARPKETSYIRTDWSIFSIVEMEDKLWLGSDSRVLKVKRNTNNSYSVIKPIYKIPTILSEDVIAQSIEGEPAFFLPSGIYMLNKNKKEIEKISAPILSDQGFMRYIFSQDGTIWLNKNENWNPLNRKNELESKQIGFLKLFDNIIHLYPDEDKNLWIVYGNNQLSKILYTKTLPKKENIRVFVKEISNSKGTRFEANQMKLNNSDFPLKFKIQAPFFIKPELTEFQYYIEGLDQDSMEWSSDKEIYIPYLPPNSYTLHVKARNVFNNESNDFTSDFIIVPPITKRPWFYVIMGLGFLFIMYFIMLIRERKLLSDKKLLESKVEVRTKEIARQKEEIEKQTEILSNQKEEITSSISYGKRIQKAIFPPKEILRKLLPEFFILFRPRDIVSGDFYWISEKNDKIIIAVADCTGHGVPGAFMSILGYTLLGEIANNYPITTAGSFLNKLRTKLKSALHQTGKDPETKDGIDMSLCIFDKKENTLQYAGAYNPLYIIRKDNLIIKKGDKMPIGIHYIKEVPFKNHKIKLKAGDVIYLFTDGYIDQFGGPLNKKYKIVPFRKLLLKIHKKKMYEQKRSLGKELNKWMDTNE